MLKNICAILILIIPLLSWTYGKGYCENTGDGKVICYSDIDKDSNKKSQNNNQDSYIQNVKDSAFDLFVKATKEYKQGKLTKEKYLEIALLAGQMGDYAQKTTEEISPTTAPDSNSTGLQDKIVKVPSALHFGSPNIENMSDEMLINLKNKQLDGIKEKFKKLQASQNALGISDLNLKCNKVSDCDAISFGQKLCGGPVSYLVVSKLDPQYNSIVDKLGKYTELDIDFQKSVQGFYGVCDIVLPPKLSCINQMCKGNEN